jgi:hypothetical protein
MDVYERGLDALTAKPREKDSTVHPALKELRGAVPEQVRSDVLFPERWALPHCRCNMLTNAASPLTDVIATDDDRVKTPSQI